MKLYIDSSFTKIKFKDTETDLQHKIDVLLLEELSVMPKDYQYTWAYKHGGDPSVKFYDPKKREFPTGLLTKVKQILMSNGYDFEVFDSRPDLFVDANDIPKSINLHDDGKDITLRAYQRRAVFEGLEKGYGIMNLATSAGKCLVADTKLLTNKGYRSIKNIFEEQHVLLSGRVGEVSLTKDLQLINRYGNPEKVGCLTRNGTKQVFKVTLDNGFCENATSNHPLLVLNQGVETWVPIEDLKVGDLVKVYKSKFVMASMSNYGVSKVVSIEDQGIQLTFDVSMPKTHSFIANGIVNHNTEIAAGLIKQLLPELQRDERIVFFTGSTEIFNQTIDRLQKRLGVKVGYWGGSKRKLSKLMVVMLPTVNKALAIDPMEKLKISGKKSELKKIALNYAPQFEDNPNALSSFQAFLRFFKPRTKIEQRIKDQFEDDIATCGSDKDVRKLFKDYSAQWIKVLESKAGDKLKKQKFVHKFLDSIVAYVADECLVGDTAIAMEDGSFKQIKDIKLGDQLLVGGKVTNVIQRKDDTLVIRHEYGDIEGSLTHPLAVRKGDKIFYKPLMQIKLGDKLLVHTGRNYIDSEVVDIQRGTNQELYDVSTEKELFIGNSLLNHNCHHTKSDTWYNSLLQCNNARYHIGLSATVDKRDDVLWMRLQSVFGDIIAKKDADSLIQAGILARPTIYLVQNTQGFDVPDEVLSKGAKLSWMDAYKYGVAENKHRNQMIARITKRAYVKNNIVLIIVNYAEQGELIAKELDEIQVNYEFLNGSQDIKYRKEKVQEVRDNKLRVVIATSIFDEGLDVSGFNVLILAGAGKSFRQVVQRIGRALRKKEGDNTAKIFDFYDTNNEYLLKHAKARQEVYKLEKFPVEEVKEINTKG